MEKSTFIIRNRSFFHFNLLLNHLDHLCILHRNSMKKFNFFNFIFQPILLCSFQFTQLGITKKNHFFLALIFSSRIFDEIERLT